MAEAEAPKDNLTSEVKIEEIADEQQAVIDQEKEVKEAPKEEAVEDVTKPVEAGEPEVKKE